MFLDIQFMALFIFYSHAADLAVETRKPPDVDGTFHPRALSSARSARLSSAHLHTCSQLAAPSLIRQTNREKRARRNAARVSKPDARGPEAPYQVHTQVAFALEASSRCLPRLARPPHPKAYSDVRVIARTLVHMHTMRPRLAHFGGLEVSADRDAAAGGVAVQQGGNP